MPLDCFDICIICVTIPTAPVWLPAYFLYKGGKKLKAHRHRKERIFFKSHSKHPMPLPLRRQFNLSDESIVNENLQSHLLRLPYSVRLNIYQHLLSNSHIIQVLTHPTLPRLTEYHIPYPSHWGPTQHINDCCHLLDPVQTWPDPDPKVRLPVNILLTCRQVYQEALPLLYNSNTFYFTDLQSLTYFQQGIRTQHFSQIRYLQLYLILNFNQLETVPLRQPRDHPNRWSLWLRVWSLIAGRMTDLRELDLSMIVMSGSYEDERQWCTPIMQLRGLRRFRMLIYHQDEGWHWKGLPEDETKNFRMEVGRAVVLPRGVTEDERLKLEGRRRIDLDEENSSDPVAPV